MAAVCLLATYGGAVWYLWPCRSTAIGRELREGHVLGPFRRRLTGEAGENCDDDAKKVHAELTAAGVAIGVKTITEFENPWPEESFTKSVKLGSDYENFAKVADCTTLDWRALAEKKGKFVAAFHKRERLARLKEILLNPQATKSGLCPRDKKELSKLYKASMAGADELDEQAEALESYSLSNLGEVGECLDPVATVHSADVENEIRKLLKKPTMPMTPHFIATNWCPVLNRIKRDMKEKYGVEDGFSVTHTHVHLLIDQLERERLNLVKQTR